MNKTTLNIIATLNILISTFSYLKIYSIMVNSESSSKGWAEIFTLTSSIFFIISELSLVSIINSITKFKKYLIVLFYLLVGIIPMTIQNQLMIIPTLVFSIIIMTISNSFISKAKDKQLISLNGILLVINTIWGITIIKM